MKFINRLEENDEDILDSLCANARLKSYPALTAVKDEIKSEYLHYRNVQGNAHSLNSALPLPAGLRSAMIKHYSSDIEVLRFIKSVRKTLSPRVCPICGSPKTSQVDHVAPKDEYPEFSFFSRNLVPACDCNGLKGTDFKGKVIGERVLHPYYDKILGERLVYLSLSGEPAFPELNIEIVAAHSNNPAVRFHVDTILRRTNVINFAAQLWAQLKDEPDSLLPLSSDAPALVSDAETKAAVLRILKMKDKEFGTPNNWFSMFYWGVLCSSNEWALRYIRNRINVVRAAGINNVL